VFLKISRIGLINKGLNAGISVAIFVFTTTSGSIYRVHQWALMALVLWKM
jgi:hypothetical protein